MEDEVDNVTNDGIDVLAIEDGINDGIDDVVENGINDGIDDGMDGGINSGIESERDNGTDSEIDNMEYYRTYRKNKWIWNMHNQIYDGIDDGIDRLWNR